MLKLTSVLKSRQSLSKLIGVVGTIAAIAVFIREPSFPTPDKLIIFLALVFMIFGRALEAIRRFGLFVLLILVYESFRGIADQLNSHIFYLTAPRVDQAVFGGLPTAGLQNWLWHGQVQWYDYVLYLPYFLHFVIPLGLGLLIWRNRDKHFWRVMNTFLIGAFLAFVTFLVFPAAPPWMASNNGFIEPITRVSSDVWSSLGIHDFPSVYQKISPNPVAAIPSLHAIWATLLVIFVWKLYGRRWAAVSAIYPVLIFAGTVYTGEHYVFDLAVGVVYAVFAYLTTPYIMKFLSRRIRSLKTAFGRLNLLSYPHKN